MEIAPKFLNLASLSHHLQGFVCEFGFPALTPVTAIKNIFVAQYTLAIEVIHDPFIEVEALVDEGVGHRSHFSAVSWIKWLVTRDRQGPDRCDILPK